MVDLLKVIVVPAGGFPLTLKTALNQTVAPALIGVALKLEVIDTVPVAGAAANSPLTGRRGPATRSGSDGSQPMTQKITDRNSTRCDRWLSMAWCGSAWSCGAPDVRATGRMLESRASRPDPDSQSPLTGLRRGMELLHEWCSGGGGGQPSPRQAVATPSEWELLGELSRRCYTLVWSSPLTP